jgi:RNA polymerase sigma factor (sigma-70 family)
MTQAQPTIPDLVARARGGDAEAWNALVDRFLPLVFAVLSRFRMSKADAEDVNQTVWLRLVEHLDSLRDADALPGWLATTTRHEAIRVLRKRDRQRPEDPMSWPGFDTEVDTDIDDELLVDERRHALREGLAQLGTERRELLLLLMHDPPLSYAEISRRMARPVGWIGPTRARALEELRATPALRSMLETEGEDRRR